MFLVALLCQETWQGRRTSRLVLIGLGTLLMCLMVGGTLEDASLDGVPLGAGSYILIESLFGG
jgi:hypothetical protein